MKPIKIALWGSLLFLTATWFMADSLPPTLGWFAWRSPLVQLSGILAIGAMSMSMLLALRPAWLEKRLNGLDKMYRLHKWLGITALSTGIFHWWWAQGTKWMVGWEWLAKPERKPRGASVTVDWYTKLLQDWHGPAEVVGEWVFYIAAILLVLALIKRFPYRIFAKTHTILAVVYLLLAWHSFVLIKQEYWAQPVGWLTALLLIAGTIAAFLVLFNRVGHKRKVKGRVAALEQDRESQTLTVELELESGWPGHKAGQFAFITTDRREGATIVSALKESLRYLVLGEGAHPYTIASAWDATRRRITIMVKALGDHTRELPEILRVGHAVRVEGPYGCFTFDGPEKRQIWIGAGIGITPFLARLQQLRAQPDGKAIDLFHPTSAGAQATLDQIEADACAVGVAAHTLISPRDGFLTGEKIRAAVPHWKNASIWFCGPAGFGKALRDDFIAQGFSPAAFHQELFEMR